ncbi:PTS sugar transporter subunit IIA [Clostridium sartagoforme]|uniref:PTS sugar transporter subunit IIA n=1 Tax=Clostridium sartagoforme TaxID=84031 RepID=A0A4S2DIW2_9CLOT|nr:MULTISPECIES: sucrose-specific PTS transporter subunit IIBC [Clostridium]MBS5938633.1 sucrose-specific PTS transporter subunit IIBC [Clostridium sp.]MBS5951826.1 sucrose-specific PTS transporter subunit IIBC [Clostridium sp.]TGY41795.1 PTS sugar transporter subunit IIA [Clostridium sartagoforme]
MSDNYQKIAKEVIEAVGGEDNIISAAHCATRLRIILKDRKKVDDKAVESIDKVKGFFFTAGQYQIIFGTGTVNKVFEQVSALGIASASKSEQSQMASEQGNNKFKRAIRIFSDIFVPIIPAMVATGLFMGVRGLLLQEQILAIFGLTPESIPASLLTFTQILTDTAFGFLPVLICWSAFKKFGGSPILGIVVGLMLVSPSLPSRWDVSQGTAEPLVLFGIKMAGYQASVLPAFLTGLVGAKLEVWFRKRISDTLDLILTPFLTLLLSLVCGLMIIGPIASEIEAVILNLMVFIFTLPFGLGGLIWGGINQLIVVTGVHQALSVVEIQMIADTGWNLVNPISTCSIVAQAGAAFAVGIKSKSKKIKALSFPSVISALLGITEPAIFGVNLRFVKPFIMGLVGGAAGGFLASLLNLKATGMGITAIPGTLLYLNNQFILYILVAVFSFGVAFALTYLFGYKDKEEN